MLIVPLTFDVVVVAALAPVLGVVAFWFVQLCMIEVQKRMLSTLRHRHEAFCRFTNYIGLLFQTLSEALGYTVTRSGIASFKVTVNAGVVEPKKEKTGVFEWIARSFLLFGPFFIPAGIALLFGYFVIGKGFVFPSAVPATFVDSLRGFVSSLFILAQEYARFLVSIDFLNPLYVGYVVVLLFFGLGMRPSYFGEQRKERIDILYDLRQILNHLRAKPLYILVIILAFYLFYLISLFVNPVWYVGLFMIFGWMALTAIIAILLTFPLLFLIKATDYIQPYWKRIPFITVIVSYVLVRVVFLFYPMSYVNVVSLLITLGVTILVTILLIRYKRTNRFKTPPKMKHVRVADGKKGTAKK